MPLPSPKYRPNVAGILRDATGEILICERLGMDGAWQFPQGGCDPGETREETLARELEEEISVGAGDFEIVCSRGPYCYLFGEGRQKRGFDGVEQYYFLADFKGRRAKIDLATRKPEFQAHRWIRPSEFRLSWLPSMKRKVYQAVFRDFFGINL